MKIPVNKILPNPEQPRKDFDQAELNELARSIMENGLIQAITVEGPIDGNYILIDGERRLRAVKLNGSETIEANVFTPTAQCSDWLMLAMVANIQRSDLGPIDEAKAYQRLINVFKISQNKLAIKIGKSQMHIKSRLQMLELEEKVQDLINDGRLPKNEHLIDALQKVPEGCIRVNLAEKLAERGATIKAGIEACNRIVEHTRADNIERDAIPSMKLSRIKTGELFRPAYDALSVLGKVPPWQNVENSARSVCEVCSLRDSASPATCRGCALVEFLIDLMKGVN
jgi:ParB family chromosome partitioning protein